MRTRHTRIASPPQGLHRNPGQIPAYLPELRQVTCGHAMNSGVITDIRKEASIARSGSTDDETKPTFGAQIAPRGRRSPERAVPWCSRVRPGVGPPPRRDLRVAFVSPRGDEHATGLRGIWRAGRFHGCTPAARCDCILHSSRAQFVEGANCVFDRQIDAS
jgi:hypothetical protein